MKRRNRLIAWISVLFLGCMLLPQPGIVQAVASDGAFQQAFVKVDGTFDTQTAGFPMDYRFDFSGHLDGKNYYALVPLGFFHAAKESGQIVTIVDNIGVEYRYAPADIADIAPENFGATVKVGGRYRATASYKKVAESFASAAGIPEGDYVQHRDYAFLEVWTGETAVTNCTIHVAVDPLGDGAYESGYYESAEQGRLYVYQYSSQALTERPTEMAEAATRPQVVLHKTETGSMQLFLSREPLRDDLPGEEPTDPTDPPEPSASAPFDPAFLRDGRFVTDAPGFPENYAFTFGSYGNDEGASKELFQAIKSSGRQVTLTTRSGVNYIFDGAQMSDLTAEQMAETIQIQALYKTSASYQTVMQKIAEKGQIYDGFYMNEDWIILDIQPWTGNATYQPTNGFPVDAQVTVRLNGGQGGAAGEAIADLFAGYACDGLLKAYVYDKTTSVQDLVEDVEPLSITANEAGEVCFTMRKPATLVFSRKDLLSGRGEPEVNTNPFEMRIKKDGKNISDGYTIELGDVQYLDLLMEKGNVRDYEYIWEVVGPGKDSVSLKEVEGANNLSYELEAVKETEAGQPFQIQVSIKGETNNFVKTGLITVVDTIYGKIFLENGQFKTDAEGFPADYVFQMPSSKYQLTYEFLNAVSQSVRDVTVIDSTGIRYIFQGNKVETVPQEQWGDAFAIKALYKDSSSYQGVMLAIAYQNGYTSYENNKDYIIVDFQAHGENLPMPVTATFDLMSKSNDPDIAAHFAGLMREGKLYIYAYSKDTQNVYKPLDTFSMTEDGAFSFELWEPITVVFSAIPLMDAGPSVDDGNGSTGTGSDGITPGGNPDTGVAFPAAAILCATAGGGLLCASRRSVKKKR